MKLTACIIVRNEQEFLTDCLESIFQITRDIVVVDTGSTDGTPELARGRGCTVIDFEWRDDFSAARNFAIEHALGDWILCIDADERLHLQTSPEELVTLLSTTKAQAFQAEIVSYVGSERTTNSLFRDRRVILFRNDPEVRFRQRVHENLTESLQNRYGSNLTLGLLPVTVEHLGYLDQVVERKKKQMRNIRLLELELKEKGPLPWIDYCLGVEWASCNQWEKATGLLERVVHDAISLPYWELAAYSLAYCYLQLGLHTRCIEMCDTALHVEKGSRDQFSLLKSVARWQPYSSISNMLAVFSHNVLHSPQDYYAFILAYQMSVKKLCEDLNLT